MKTFLSLLALIGLITPAFAAAPPPVNDDFANRTILIASGSISVAGVNAKATTEANEPTIDGETVGKSVWWSWTPPFNGPTTINTIGSSYDTQLGVFTGVALGALTSIAENDDANGLYTSSVTFNAVGGVPYVILIGGFNGAGGKIKLNITISGTGPCSYSLAPSSRSVTYTASNSSVGVTTTTGCTWSAVSNDSWLAITAGASGSGSGTVTYSIAANTALTARSGTLTVAGLTHTVTQAAAPACTYSISPPSASFTASPVTNSFAMTAGTGCSWTATPNASWLTIQSGASGTGNGTTTYVVATNSLSNSRTGTITVAGLTHTVTQDGTVPCSYSISPTTASFTSSGGTSNIVISTVTACAWTASSPVSWVTFSTTNGTGNATVTYTVAANATTVPRSGVLTVAANSFTVSQAGAACTYALNPTSASASAAGASGTIAMTAGVGCAWTSVANVPWLTITSGTSGSGNGTIGYTVAANPNPSIRAGTLTIGGQTFTVNQAAAVCSYSIVPTAAHYSDATGTGSIAVTTGTGCAWTAVSNDAFITVNSGTPGSGNGTVGYTISANVTTASRTGTITVAGSTFTVTQDGTAPCTYGITPSSASASYSGITNTVAVTANTGCAWSASSAASWITLSPASGTGNGTVTYVAAANSSSLSRIGTLTIAGNTFTLTQTGAPCTYSTSPASASYAYTGGTGTIVVTATAGCSWTSSSDSTWLTATSGASGTGNGTLTYAVASYSGITNRTGRLTVASRVTIVTQTAAPCVYSIVPTSVSVAPSGGVGSVDLTTSDIGCSWTAMPSASWITLPVTSGTGSGTINYAIAPTISTSDRSGSINISGQLFSITQLGDTISPTNVITSPSNGSTVSNVVSVASTATDNVAVSRVDFYYDSAVLAGSDFSSPYAVSFNTTNLSNGAHTFYSRAFDLANNQGSSATNSVTVSNGSPINTNTWSQRFGGTGSDIGHAVVVDSSGNIYMAGTFVGAVSFGGSSLTNAGGNDIFIAKYSSAGVHQWSKRYGGTGSELVSSMALGPGNNIFLGGYFLGTANFGGTNTVSAGNLDGFVAEYDSSGNFVWSRGFGSVAVDVVNSVAADSTGKVAATGTFQGSVNFGGTTLTSVSNGTDLYVAQYSNTGAHLWSKNFPNDGDDYAQGVAVDSSDNVLITGYFKNYINFGGGNLVSSDLIFGGPEVFIAKFNSSGTYTWANRYGGDKSERGLAIAVDGNNDVAVVGDFVPYTNLGGGQLTVGTSTVSDLFLLKVSGVDGAHRWSVRMGGSLLEVPNAITFDSTNNVFVTGSFNGSATFGTTTLTSAGTEDVFMAKYSSAGVFSTAKSFGGTGTDVGYDVAVDSGGYQVITGAFSGTANFNGTSLISSGGLDVFLIRLIP